jgi:hypothetical protein
MQEHTVARRRKNRSPNSSSSSSPGKRPTNLVARLPEELWLVILSHLHEIQDITSAALVCKQWYRLTQDPYLENERGSLFLLGTTVVDFSRLMVAHERVKEVIRVEPTFANWEDYERVVKQDGKYVACLVPAAGQTLHHSHGQQQILEHLVEPTTTSTSSPTTPADEEEGLMAIKMLHLESAKVLWEVAWPSRSKERLVCFFQDKLKVWFVKEHSITWHLKRTGRLGTLLLFSSPFSFLSFSVLWPLAAGGRPLLSLASCFVSCETDAHLAVAVCGSPPSRSVSGATRPGQGRPIRKRRSCPRPSRTTSPVPSFLFRPFNVAIVLSGRRVRGLPRGRGHL